MLIGGAQPMFFVQTPKQVWMIYSGNQEVRRIYLDVPHTANPTPSWYGESVGHYEGDTLMVDNIAQNDKTFIDNYRTPHTEKLHVVERWRMVDGGEGMEVVFTVEDPDAFYQPWTGTRHGLPVKVGMPREVMELMKLYPQPVQQSGVEYLPIDIPRQRRV
jgi:hypothetical protein